ncbi:PTS IIA-like nitrogen regulatory protein PtsN [Teredinibacter haidensis]|uniref:PTS IIA-like nitrogen regulatory protein PtsN n=1 Tax=Teredinibacter haidensis TaxID=2731755 RepID=UPI00094906F9|nr:PTS IIA-like nitrogen regulatory protein PtsN [Teredinibacter haidensis]
MQISTILTDERCKAKATDASKKRVLESLASLFASDLPDTDETTIFQCLIARERLGSTGIGQGVAIPHCRLSASNQTLCACITLDHPVDFDAVDGAPVDVIFAILVPEDAEDSHLQTLATLAEALQNPNFTRKLKACSSNEELFRVAAGVN